MTQERAANVEIVKGGFLLTMYQDGYIGDKERAVFTEIKPLLDTMATFFDAYAVEQQIQQVVSRKEIDIAMETLNDGARYLDE